MTWVLIFWIASGGGGGGAGSAEFASQRACLQAISAAEAHFGSFRGICVNKHGKP